MADRDLAARAILEKAILDELTDGFVQRPEVQALLERVEVTASEDKAGADLPNAPFDLVWVDTTDGRILRHAGGLVSLA